MAGSSKVGAVGGGSGNSAPAARSRLGRGLSSLIKVSLPEEPAGQVEASGGHRKGHTGKGDAMEGNAGSVGGGNPPAAEVRVVEKVVEKFVYAPSGEALLIAVTLIRPNPHQPRREFGEVALRELADSIKSNGIIQPLVVKAAGGAEGTYELIAGERRLRAAKLAGLGEVPCHVKKVDALTQAQMALVENIQREGLNPIERAEGYQVLVKQLGLTQSELAIRLGEERSAIANFMRLLELAEPVKRWIRDGVLSLGHAKLLAAVTDVLEQERMGKLVLAEGLSVRNLERMILAGAGNGVKVASPKAAGGDTAGREAHFMELEKSIAQQLGMRVQMKAGRSKGRGKVTIHYGSLDQFDQLMEKLGVEVG